MEINNEELIAEQKTDVVQVEEKAEKKKEKKEKKSKKTKEQDSWFMKILKEEHKWETYLLGFISCFAMGVGALILSGEVKFDDNTPVFADYAVLAGWLFVGFGMLGFLLFIIPIFKPTRKEIKHLSYPNRSLFGANICRVFTFLIIMALVFLLYEAVLSAVKGIL